MRFQVGKKYYLRYLNYEHDPMPYLFVTYWDRHYTKGFNLHYLPNIKFKIPTDRYRRVNEDKWKKAFDNMTNNGMFKKFIDDLDRAADRKMSTAAYQKYTSYLDRKYKWCMQAYRCYHTPLLKLRTDYPKVEDKE